MCVYLQCVVSDERHVLEVVTRWMKAGEEEGGVRGEDLLNQVCLCGMPACHA